jgi:hypothetical protein
MRLPGQSNKPGNPDSQIIPEMALFASIIQQKGAEAPNLITVCYDNHYLFITYIVTSKPNLISVAAGVVHIIFSFFKFYTHRVYNCILLQ